MTRRGLFVQSPFHLKACAQCHHLGCHLPVCLRSELLLRPMASFVWCVWLWFVGRSTGPSDFESFLRVEMVYMCLVHSRFSASPGGSVLVKLGVHRCK